MMNDEVFLDLNRLDTHRHKKLKRSLERLRGLDNTAESVVIRPRREGELGWITWRHCVLYKEEYGFDETFEYYLLAGMVQYLRDLKGKGQVWVAECGGTVVGSIAIVETATLEAQLRWFLIEPGFRGIGLGKAFMETALDFCRDRGYERVFLWTVSDLLAARHLYEAYGFTLRERKSHFIWGRDIVEELWETFLQRWPEPTG
jgi:GNAT superfamily N-acetyltransferase